MKYRKLKLWEKRLWHESLSVNLELHAHGIQNYFIDFNGENLPWLMEFSMNVSNNYLFLYGHKKVRKFELSSRFLFPATCKRYKLKKKLTTLKWTSMLSYNVFLFLSMTYEYLVSTFRIFIHHACRLHTAVLHTYWYFLLLFCLDLMGMMN